MGKQNEDTVVDVDDTPAGGTPAAAATVDEDAADLVVDEDADLEGGLPSRAIENGDGTITLPLREPVEIQVRSARSGTRMENFDALTFHRLTGADLNAITAASKETQPIVLLARSARVREPIMKAVWTRMDAADISDALRTVDHFFGSGPRTGR